MFAPSSGACRRACWTGIRTVPISDSAVKGRPQRAAPAGPPVARSRPVSALRARAEEYLAMRRALGFKLESHGPRLMSFVQFCENRDAGTVTTDLAVEWATSTARGSDHEVYQARR